MIPLPLLHNNTLQYTVSTISKSLKKNCINQIWNVFSDVALMDCDCSVEKNLITIGYSLIDEDFYFESSLVCPVGHYWFLLSYYRHELICCKRYVWKQYQPEWVKRILISDDQKCRNQKNRQNGAPGLFINHNC